MATSWPKNLVSISNFNSLFDARFAAKSTNDLPDFLNKRYVLDADLIKLANLSGVNTGDQTISLTGDVTGSGTGSFAATLADDAVTNAKLANMATQTFKGRTTAGTGDPEDLTIAQAKTMLNLAGTNTGNQTITLTGEATGSGTGSFPVTITQALIDNRSPASPELVDTVLFADSSAGNALRKCSFTSVMALLDLTPYVPYVGAGADIDLGNSQKIVNCQDPTNPQDVATKNYVDAFVPYTGATADVDLGSFNILANQLVGGSLVNQFGQPVFDLNSFASYDGSLVLNINLNSRQLIDATGSYPSVDWGGYGLWSIPTSNSGPLLGWGSGFGDSVKIYAGSAPNLVGDFANGQLSPPAGGSVTLDWNLRLCYDNTSAVSIDWDYHTLNASSVISLDWQNKYLYSNAFGSVIAVDYGNHLLNNGGGFLCVDFTNHVLYESTGTTAVLNFTAQQTTAVTPAAHSSGATNLLYEDTTFDGYTVGQIVGALRAYGLLQ